MRKELIVCLMFLLFFINESQAYETKIRIINKVQDGDTVLIHLNRNKKQSIRLYGIDAPETRGKGKPWPISQPFGEKASHYLKNRIEGKIVKLIIIQNDYFSQRLDAVIYLDDVDINLEMIKEGYAEASNAKYLNEDYQAQYLAAEKEAKNQKKNIWSQGVNYESPKHFRDNYEKKKAKYDE